MDDQYKVIDIGSAKNGQTKCPKCGSTDISQNKNTGKLRCNFCRHEFEPEILEDTHIISELEGTSIYKGASNILSDNNIVTIKCESCGADVVIDTSTTTQARCHWCRNTLSLNDQVPNGAVPDVILPFYLEKEDAAHYINEFVGKRKFFAHPKFRREFSTENICGVYFPYMIIDINGHMKLYGEGEITTRTYKEGSGDKEHTVYDADVYSIKREFNISIDDLCIESSASRLDVNNKEKTNNIINAIMPFDTENCIQYDSNYLRGYTSEKRDTDISDLKHISETQGSDISKHAAIKTIKKYDRGVRWDYVDFESKGDLWKSAYLPVWLYSYLEEKKNGNILHYVAVNARTAETVGSIPLNKPKLFIISALIELIGFFMLFFKFPNWEGGFRFDFNSVKGPQLIVLSLGFLFYFIINMRYRNSNARHTYEKETSYEMSDLRGSDKLINSITGTSSSWIDGENSRSISSGKNMSKFDALVDGFTNKDNIKINGVPLDEVKEQFSEFKEQFSGLFNQIGENKSDDYDEDSEDSEDW